jgi:hypothetical protein
MPHAAVLSFKVINSNPLITTIIAKSKTKYTNIAYNALFL